MRFKLRRRPIITRVTQNLAGKFVWECYIKQCDRLSPEFNTEIEAREAARYHATLENMAANNGHLERKIFDRERSYPKVDRDTIVISSWIQRNSNLSRARYLSIDSQSA